MAWYSRFLRKKEESNSRSKPTTLYKENKVEETQTDPTEPVADPEAEPMPDPGTPAPEEGDENGEGDEGTPA